MGLGAYRTISSTARSSKARVQPVIKHTSVTPANSPLRSSGSYVVLCLIAKLVSRIADPLFQQASPKMATGRALASVERLSEVARSNKELATALGAAGALVVGATAYVVNQGSKLTTMEKTAALEFDKFALELKARDDKLEAATKQFATELKARDDKFATELKATKEQFATELKARDDQLVMGLKAATVEQDNKRLEAVHELTLHADFETFRELLKRMAKEKMRPAESEPAQALQATQGQLK